MNENNEKNKLPEDLNPDSSVEAFKVQFSDNVVESEDNSSDIASNVDENNLQSTVTTEEVGSGEHFTDTSNEHSPNTTTDTDSTITETADQHDTSSVPDSNSVEDCNAKPATNPDEVVDQPTNHKKRKKSHKNTTAALMKELKLAVFLSTISIIILAIIATLLSVGILPAGNRMVYVSISNLGPIETPSASASAETLEQFKSSVVVINVTKSSGGGTGSGIILSQDGYIVTNYHVVQNAKKIEVCFYNSSKNEYARLIGYSERDDIAVIKVDVENLTPATFADSSSCQVGDTVYAVGAPEGSEFGWSITSGIISDPIREVKIYKNDYTLEKKMYLLQTDASVNPGNSGGPLINARAEVVGIVTLKRSDAAGIGFALPSSASLEIIEAIIETGSADGITSKITKGRPLIGIVGTEFKADTWYQELDEGIMEVSAAYAKTHADTCIKLSVSGVYVVSLNPELDACNHLIVGDVITHVNGTKVLTVYNIMDIVNECNGGDTVTITFIRDEETYTADITLGEEK